MATLPPTDRLWKSYQMVMKMAVYRKYHTPCPEQAETREEFVERYGDPVDRRAMATNFVTKSGEKILFCWIDDLNHAEINGLYQEMKTNSIFRAVVVTNKITSHTSTVIRALKNQRPPVLIETFDEPTTLYTVVDHVIVPRHIICSTKTKEKVLRDYAVKPDGLPQIKAEDPICKYIGACRGNLVKIVRPSDSIKTVGDKPLYDITYRLVV